MKDQEVKVYDDTAEFIDDVFGDDIPQNLNQNEFKDYIFEDVTYIGKMEFDDGNKYSLYEVGSSDAIYALTDIPYRGYRKWCEHMKNI